MTAFLAVAAPGNHSSMKNYMALSVRIHSYGSLESKTFSHRRSQQLEIFHKLREISAIDVILSHVFELAWQDFQ